MFNKKTIIFVLGVQRKGSYPLSGLNILCYIIQFLIFSYKFRLYLHPKRMFPAGLT
nr:MAG TPA: hypothetical protein [Caudoviricetes sp.]